MAAGRPASLIGTCDQWARAAHLDTSIDGADGTLTLGWTGPPPAIDPADGACPAAGLATDRLCRIYRVVDRSRVERYLVGDTANGVDPLAIPAPTVVVDGPAPTDDDIADAFGPSGASDSGGSGDGGLCPAGPDFAIPPGDGAGTIAAIAIDDDDRLFLADPDAAHVAVLDLWSGRLLRMIRTSVPGAPDRVPVGLATHGSTVYAALRAPAGLSRFTASRGPEEVAMPAATAQLPDGSEPSRIAVLADGTVAMLWHDPDGAGWIVAGERRPMRVGPASDIVVDGEGALVLAPCAAPLARTTLRRFAPRAGGWARARPLDATNYDGGGLVVTSAGRIGYFTADGFRVAAIDMVDYATRGRCITYRLDSGGAANRWGRVFVEACIPDGTAVHVAAVTSDDEFATAVSHTPAEPAACTAVELAASAPLPPDEFDMDTMAVVGGVHARRDPITPWWWPDEADRYRSYEAPIDAPPGRYLWVTIELSGNRRRTPRVRELRVERRTHRLLRRLPALYSADDQQEAFLRRYLSMFDGFVHDLDVRAQCREILVDPHSTPSEALDWLASFLGLVLDDSWADAARRELVSRITQLYRRRGTLWALGTYMEVFLAGDRAGDPSTPPVQPIIVEHYRLRGVGGPVVGDDPALSSRSVLGAGFRVGGSVGELGSRPLDPNDDRASAHARHAHRFSVLIPRPLGAEEHRAVARILDTERPAHTTYELCTVDAGMRVGRGTHIGLSSVVGPTGTFEAAVTDLSLIGRGALLGGATTGVAVEAARIGHTARVG